MTDYLNKLKNTRDLALSHIVFMTNTGIIKSERFEYWEKVIIAINIELETMEIQ